jgi:PKD repeat protein
MRKLLLLSLSLFLANSRIVAQCSMVPVTLNDRINNSSLVIEGKVIAQKSFWNQKHDYIYTSNLVDVYKVFKGVAVQTQIEVVTDGGEIDLMLQKVEPSLQLNINDVGIFTLQESQLAEQFAKPNYTAYADAQGFMRYDMGTGSATDIFTNYQSISGDLYPLIQQVTGSLHKNVAPFTTAVGQKVIGSNSTAAITGISPTTITAGTFSVLTITGSGFGATQGTSFVEFKNADDGGATFIQPHSSQYVSWSATQIQVMVPTKASTLSGTAGTGQVRVTVAGSPTLSAQTLTVSYGHLNAGYTGTAVPVQVRNTRHVTLNGAGGITWRLYSGFDANASAKASFLRAFQTWRCATYINWVTGTTTTVNAIASDGINIARFDIGTELPTGVLGRCTSYWSGCFTGTVINYYVSELDICFDDATNWQFGTALATGTQYDFESVAVHELGHGHQLSHVINSADVMHYSIANAQNKRTLNVDDINGGTAVMTRNLSGGVCGQTVMTALNSTNCALAAPTASFNITSPVCVGQTVTLTDLSTGSPTSWAWTMAGGTPATSTLQNTSTTYSTAGTYSITLIAANGTGTSTPLTKTISVLATPTVNVAGTKTVCSGNSTTLTATGATTYTWSPGALTGSVQAFTPAATTIYTITGSNGTCSSNTIVTVTVTPTPTIIATSATICSGNSATLSATGATSYTWNPGGLTGTSQTFTPAATTIYTVTGANGQCTSTKTTNINVNPTPTVNVTGTSTVCSGSSRTLTASGATNYTWMPGSITGSAVVVSPTATTVYTVTGSNGSCSSTKTFTLTVFGVPLVSSTSATICAGNTATVFVTGTASGYTWNPGGLTGMTQTFSPASTTVYTVTGSNGNCSTINTSTVTVIANPTVFVSGTSPICAGSNATLVASGASSYTWNPGSLTGPAQTVTPSSTTIYTVTGSNGNNCTNTKTFTVSVTPSPTLTVGSATICQGASASVTVTGASSYTWNPGGLTGSSQVLTPTVTTVYTVTGSNGTCSSSKTTTIVVNSKPAVTVNNPTVCAGQNINLTSSGGVSYSWTGPASFTSSVQNPTITNASVSNAGQYTVTVTSSQGCTNTGVANVTVNSLPSVLPSNNGPVCSGSTLILLVGSAPGGTYMWSGPSSFTSASQNPSIVNASTANAGIYTVSVTVAGCTGTGTTAAGVTPSPTITASNATICPGGSATLTASGATNYTWNPGALTGSTQVVSPSSNTIYTITGSSGTCSGTRTVMVTVGSGTITSTSNSPVCEGNTLQLIATGATTYTWTGPVGFTSALSNPTVPNIQLINAGTYTVIATIGTCTFMSTKNVIVNALPSVSVSASGTNICSGQSTTLTSSGALSYTYNPGFVTANPAAFSPTANTTYTVSGMASTGCVGTSAVTVSVSVCSGISVVNSTGNFVLYPNPTKDLVTIEFGETFTGKVVVYNAIGQEILKQTVSASKTTGIDLSAAAKGVYFVKMQSESARERTVKVVKE